MSSRPASPPCPTCKKPVFLVADSAGGLRRGPFAPFCSERCKLVDLQKWLGGSYAIAGRPLDEDELPRPDTGDDE